MSNKALMGLISLEDQDAYTNSVVVCSDETGAELQTTPVLIDQSGNITGVNNLTVTGDLTVDDITLDDVTVDTINKVTITAPATSATLTLVNGSTLATSGAFSTTLTATATTNVTLPTTGTLATVGGNIGAATATTFVTNTLSVLNTVSGTATLVAGTVTVSTAAIATGDKVFLTRNTPGGSVDDLSVPSGSIVNGTSFVINSVSNTDTSTVNWFIIKTHA